MQWSSEFKIKYCFSLLQSKTFSNGTNLRLFLFVFLVWFKKKIKYVLNCWSQLFAKLYASFMFTVWIHNSSLFKFVSFCGRFWNRIIPILFQHVPTFFVTSSLICFLLSIFVVSGTFGLFELSENSSGRLFK